MERKVEAIFLQNTIDREGAGEPLASGSKEEITVAVTVTGIEVGIPPPDSGVSVRLVSSLPVAYIIFDGVNLLRRFLA